MNILLYVTPGSARIALSTAKMIKEWYPDSAFSAITYRNYLEKRELKNNDKISFEQIISEEEISKKNNLVDSKYIEYIQSDILKKFPIGKVISHDRYLLYNDRLSLLEKRYDKDNSTIYNKVAHSFKRIENIIVDEKIDIVIYTGYDLGPSTAQITEIMSKHYDVPVVKVKHARIDNRIIIHKIPSKKDVLDQTAESDRSRKKKGKRINRTYTFLERLKNHFKFVVKNASIKKKSDYRQSPIKYYTRRVREKIVSYYYENKAIGEKKLPPEYIYFPLHVEPELTLLKRAPNFRNQKYVLELLSTNISYPYKIVVKEHPMDKGGKTAGFYNYIEKLPSVVLASIKIDSEKIIKNSLGVVSISGTSSLEAALMSKPSCVFGDVYFEKYFKSISKIDSPKDILSFLNNELNESIDNRDAVKEFRKKLNRSTVNINLVELNRSSNIEQIMKRNDFRLFCLQIKKHIESSL